MHRWTQMHRSRPGHARTWARVAVGVAFAVAASSCTSASRSGTTVLASAESTGGSVSAALGASDSAAASVAVGADIFTCPSAAEINALTAMGFTAAVGNGADHCEYVVTTGSTQAVRITIDHPPASATSMNEALAKFRAAIVAAGNVVLTTAPQYSADSFIARYGDLSCSVFALARDGQVMQVQASHRTPVPVDDCSLAQSITAVAGTSGHAAAPGSGSVDSSPPDASGPETPVSVPPAASTPVPVSPTPSAPAPVSPTSSAPAPTTAPVPTTSVPTTPVPTTQVPTTPLPPTPTTRRPTTPSSTSEVLIFSTGPAASFTLPTGRPTRTSR